MLVVHETYPCNVCGNVTHASTCCHVHIYMYIYTYIYVHIYIHVYALFFGKNNVPGICMPCVCVMHCRRRFFFGKNGVPGIFMPCVCVMHCRRRFFFGKNDVPRICMPCVWTSYIMWGDPGQRTANFVKTIGKATGSEGRTSLKSWANSFQANKTKSNFQ